MAGFHRTVVIDRPVQQVFDFATDLKNASILLPNVTEVEMVTPGELGPGAKFRETRRMGKRECSAIIEVIDHVRPEVHSARSAMMGMNATYRFRFTPQGPGTRVDMEAIVQGNWLWKLFLGMMSRMMEREDGAMLERLKQALETQHSN